MTTVTKGYVLRCATDLSQAAQQVTRSLRQHGWNERYVGNENGHLHFRDATAADKLRNLDDAIRAVRYVEGNAANVRAWLTKYLDQEYAKAEGRDS